MKGSVVLEKINDLQLRQKWEGKLMKLARAFKELNAVRTSGEDDPSGMRYFEAVTRFSEARDDERTFFWKNFVEERVEDITTKTQKIKTSESVQNK
jgi:hypothetical protein